MKHFLQTLLLTALLLPACLLAQQRQLNILSYNVHNGIGLDRKTDYPRIAHIIRQADPDIAALQELDSATLRSKGLDVLKELARLTDMHPVFAPTIDYQGGKYGIGLLSKQQPLRCEAIPLPGREEKRTVLIAEFSDYVFCATHFSLTPEDQLTSVRILRQKLQNIRKPVFLAGDMNSIPSSVPQQELAKQFITLNDTACHTFPADTPDRCIDYIYAVRNPRHHIRVQTQKVLPEAVASDHRPVQVIVEISPCGDKK